MIMKWLRRRDPVVSMTVATMMADISREVVETAKADVDIQFYIDQIQKVAESGERSTSLYLYEESEVDRTKKQAIAASLKRLGFKILTYDSRLYVCW